MTLVQSRTEVGVPDRSPKRWLWAWALLAVLVVVLAAWVVGWSPMLSVREVRVLGVDPTVATEVRQVAAVSLGTPLAQVSAADVTARVETIPTVASVEIRRGWPNVLVIVITERVAVAVVADGAAFTLVEPDAATYSFTATRPPGLPLLTAPDGPVRMAALAVLTTLPSPLRSQVVGVRAGTANDVVLTLRSGTQVRWGGTDQGARKAQIVTALLARRPALIDVTAPELPTTSGTLKP
ncbi:MAG: FtsQ-type POTRA domain-containing protein [Candidatus Nanopelagicales bacterium]